MYQNDNSIRVLCWPDQPPAQLSWGEGCSCTYSVQCVQFVQCVQCVDYSADIVCYIQCITSVQCTEQCTVTNTEQLKPQRLLFLSSDKLHSAVQGVEPYRHGCRRCCFDRMIRPWALPLYSCPTIKVLIRSRSSRTSRQTQALSSIGSSEANLNLPNW